MITHVQLVHFTSGFNSIMGNSSSNFAFKVETGHISVTDIILFVVIIALAATTWHFRKLHVKEQKVIRSLMMKNKMYPVMDADQPLKHQHLLWSNEEAV